MSSALAALLLSAASGPSIPALTGPVVDVAGALDAQSRGALDALARDARARHGGAGVQLGFLVIPSLDGVPIEDYSIRVAEAWQLGTKGKDNGLLFVVSTGDHRARIEVGGGLEGRLTDLQASRIIEEELVPQFRAGHVGAGLLLGAQQALAELGEGTAPPMRQPRRREANSNLLSLLFMLLLIGLSLVRGLLPGGRGRRGGFWMGSGGGSFGGGGGGGWSGGGGGFSGGGASGGW
ncbi:MAG: TPM domain-containing protein [Deltaproteobacteria bacterium]